MSRRVLSALTLDLAVEIERDLLRRDDIHLVTARSIDELVTLARDGAALCLVEPLLPDGDALDALDALRTLAAPVPVVLVTLRDAPPARGVDEGFAAIIQLPDPDGAFAEVIGRLLGAPRRRGARRFASARVRDEAGAPLGRVVDLAVGGLAVRTRRKLSVGDKISISIELVTQDVALPARAEVVRVEEEVVALRLEAPSAALSSALELTLAPHFAPRGFSFRPSTELGPRTAAIGGTLADGPALTALVTFMLDESAEVDAPSRLALHELAPLDEAGVDRWIALVARLPGVGLLGCPAWFMGLAGRLPALLGKGEGKARVASIQLPLRCTACHDELEDEARWSAASEMRAAIAACLQRPCYVCGGTLVLEEPLEVLIAALER